MKRFTFLLILCLFVLASCSRDPEVAAQKYISNGNKYFDRGKYKEASIMYRRALQKNMRSGEAWYRLGLTNLKIGQSGLIGEARRNFLRAVDLDKANKNDDAVAKLADIDLLAYLADPQRKRIFRTP
jgi:tetratricopeptide (TPR) repeat protein